MAAESGRTDSPLNDLQKLILNEPQQVHFFQAVRLLQLLMRDCKPVGHFIAPQDETIRFGSRPSLAFPASEIFDLQQTPDGKLRITVEFMGLCSAISVLPDAYTEFVLGRKREKDSAMEEFLNIFNHRMISFFYRAWEKYRAWVTYERNGEDELSRHLLEILGMSTDDLRRRGGFQDEGYLNFAPLLARHTRSSTTLKQLLEEYFQVPVEIEQFAGTWRELDPENRTCFTGMGGASEQLGRGVVAGDEVWDLHGRIRIALGPMPLSLYLRFLPGQEAHRDLTHWLQLYSNGAYETEVRLVLDRADVPACELGSSADAGPKLGLVSWLRTRPLNRDPADATYLIQ